MMRYSIQRYCCRNDANGNPRRVFVIRDERGTIVATADEGYEGRSAVMSTLQTLGAPLRPESEYGTFGRFDVIDLGDVDVGPSAYRRMKNHRPT